MKKRKVMKGKIRARNPERLVRSHRARHSWASQQPAALSTSAPFRGNKIAMTMREGKEEWSCSTKHQRKQMGNWTKLIGQSVAHKPPFGQVKRSSITPQSLIEQLEIQVRIKTWQKDFLGKKKFFFFHKTFFSLGKKQNLFPSYSQKITSPSSKWASCSYWIVLWIC